MSPLFRDSAKLVWRQGKLAAAEFLTFVFQCLIIPFWILATWITDFMEWVTGPTLTRSPYLEWNKPVELLAIIPSEKDEQLKYFGGLPAQFADGFVDNLDLPEKIAQAAIRHPDGMIYSVSQPGRHHHVEHLVKRLKKDGYRGSSGQGFITTHGRFVNRRDAFVIAVREGQLTKRLERLAAEPGKHYDGPELYSEDMW
jgi:hypothetical protein